MRRTRALLYQTETLKAELLNTPVQQLSLSIEDTLFAQAIPVVKGELRRAGITQLEPIFYISTGYGCIAGQPLIAPPASQTASGVPPIGFGGVTLTNVQVDTATRTISADVPAGTEQGYLTLSPAVTVMSIEVVGGRLVVRD